MNVPGLDAYYGDPPDDDEDGPCDMCAFTDTHCGECEDCCASVEDHPEIHPEPEPDCNLCTLVALTRVSLRVVELENRIQAVRDVCDSSTETMSWRPPRGEGGIHFPVVRVDRIIAALDRCYLAAEVERQAEVEALRGQVQAVRDIHRKQVRILSPGPNGVPIRTYCRECEAAWPCKTSLALDGEQ